MMHGSSGYPIGTAKVFSPLGAPTWFTYRFRQKAVDHRNMKLEGWIDGKSFGPYTDNGKMTELNDKAKRKLRKVLDNKDRGALHGKMTKLSQVWAVGA